MTLAVGPIWPPLPTAPPSIAITYNQPNAAPVPHHPDRVHWLRVAGAAARAPGVGRCRRTHAAAALRRWRRSSAKKAVAPPSATGARDRRLSQPPRATSDDEAYADPARRPPVAERPRAGAPGWRVRPVAHARRCGATAMRAGACACACARAAAAVRRLSASASVRSALRRRMPRRPWQPQPTRATTDKNHHGRGQEPMRSTTATPMPTPSPPPPTAPATRHARAVAQHAADTE